MAVCKFCDGEMRLVTGCTVEQYDDFADKVVRDRIRYGQETRKGLKLQLGEAEAAKLLAAFPDPQSCHDCGVMQGEFHHPGCDKEECPRCNLQALSCGCTEQ